MKKLQPQYTGRIAKVFEYIDNNLENSLSLKEVAKVAHYSPFHFHRIFKAITNEPLNSYVTRKRIEKAASVLIRKKEISVTELSSRYGFSSNAAFTKVFKSFYGIAPSKFKAQAEGPYTKVSRLKNNSSNKIHFERYVKNIGKHASWINTHAKVEVKRIPAFQVAYLTHIGKMEAIGKTYEKLIAWASSEGLLDFAETKLLTLYHDSFKITEPSQIRLSTCVTLTKPLKREAEVGITTIQGGKFLTATLEIILPDFEHAWTSLFVWMNESGHQPRDGQVFEIYHNDYRKHPEKKCFVEFFIPIK